MGIICICFSIFAGITAILAKIGIRNTDSNLATAIRTIIILIFSWLMVFIIGSQNFIYQISGQSLLFLILSGLATGASWLCYFKALQVGDVNKVTPIDKSSIVLTMILAFIFLDEKITWIKFIGMCAIGIGTYMMITKKKWKLRKQVITDGYFTLRCQQYLRALLPFLEKWESAELSQIWELHSEPLLY